MILFLVIPKSMENIDLGEVLYVKRHANTSKVYLKSGVCQQSDVSFEKHLDALEDGFMQIHQSYIVNLNNVVQYYKLGEVKMVNNKRLPVARTRKKQLQEMLTKSNS